MRRPRLAPLLAFACAALVVPRSLADTRLAVPDSPLTYGKLTLRVAGTGKRTFLLYPSPGIEVTLGLAPARFEHFGHLVALDPGSTPFQSMFVAVANARSKMDEEKGRFTLRYASRKDAATGVFAFLDVFLVTLDSSLASPWLNTNVAVDTAKMSGKVKRLRQGDLYSGKVTLAFSGLTFLGAKLKGKVRFAFAQVTEVP